MSVYTRLTKEELEYLLNEYDIGDLTDIEGINEGITNSNFYLQTTNSRYILTIFEEPNLNLDYAIKLMEHLSHHQIPCPRPFKSKDNENIKKIQNKPVAIFSLLPGKTLSDTTPSLNMCEQIGEVLAKIHVNASKFNENYSGSRDFIWFNKTYEKLKSKLNTEEEIIIKDELISLSNKDFNKLPLGVIHADLFRDNTLFINDKLTGVIDFYYACNGYLLYDLAIVINDWCLNEDKTINIERKESIIQSYNKIRKIEQIEKDYWPEVLKHAALRFWLSRLHDKYFPTDGEITHILDPDEFKLIFLDRMNNNYSLIF